MYPTYNEFFQYLKEYKEQNEKNDSPGFEYPEYIFINPPMDCIFKTFSNLYGGIYDKFEKCYLNMEKNKFFILFEIDNTNIPVHDFYQIMMKSFKHKVIHIDKHSSWIYIYVAMILDDFSELKDVLNKYNMYMKKITSLGEFFESYSIYFKNKNQEQIEDFYSGIKFQKKYNNKFKNESPYTIEYIINCKSSENLLEKVYNKVVMNDAFKHVFDDEQNDTLLKLKQGIIERKKIHFYERVDSIPSVIKKENLLLLTCHDLIKSNALDIVIHFDANYYDINDCMIT